MEQITETTDIFKSSTSTLLGRRQKEGYNPPLGEKRVKTCHGCGKAGHFARDNPSCFRKMKRKSEEYQKRKAEEAKYRKNQEKKKSNRIRTGVRQVRKR